MNSLASLAAALLPLLVQAQELPSQEALDFVVIPGTHTAVVARKGGVLERVDLDSKRSPTRNGAHGKGPGSRVWIDLLGPRLLAVGDREVAVHHMESLDVLATIERPKGAHSFGTSPSGGAFVMAKPRGPLQLFAVVGEGEETSIKEVALGKQITEPTAAAFSPDGSLLAVAAAKEAHIYSVEDGAFRLSLPATATARSVAFHGNHRVLLGWGEEGSGGPAGVDVFPVNSSSRLAQLRPGGHCPFGANASFVAGYPDLGLVVFSVSSAGHVTAYHDKDWSMAWSIDFGGGNPSQLNLHRQPGAKVALSSGMSGSHSGLIDLKKGVRGRTSALRGLSQLQSTTDGKLTLGIEKNELVVVTADDHRH